MATRVKKTHTVNVNVRVKDLSIDQDDDGVNLEKEFVPEGAFTLSLDYPLSRNYIFTVKGPLTVKALCSMISTAYHKIYLQEDYYGVWGHTIDDLWIEELNINHETKTIEVFIGS